MDKSGIEILARRKQFIFYRDQLNTAAEELDGDEFKAYIMAVLASYDKDEIQADELSTLGRLLLKRDIGAIKANNQTYLARSRNGSRGGRPPKDSENNEDTGEKLNNHEDIVENQNNHEVNGEKLNNHEVIPEKLNNHEGAILQTLQKLTDTTGTTDTKTRKELRHEDTKGTTGTTSTTETSLSAYAIDKVQPIDFEGIRAYYKQCCPNLPQVRGEVLSDKRRQLVADRIYEHSRNPAESIDDGKRTVKEAIDKVAASKYLNGDSKSGFKAGFDWIFNAENFIKILEGNYDNHDKESQRKQKQADVIARFLDRHKDKDDVGERIDYQ